MKNKTYAREVMPRSNMQGNPTEEQADAERAAALKRLEKCDIAETTQDDGTHTINKKTVFFCDPEYKDENTVAHVWIHEFAHVLNPTIGHGHDWQYTFDMLQQIATRQGWFKNYQKLKLNNYCGGRYNG